MFEILLNSVFKILSWLGDSAEAYQLGFQDPATTTMEGIYLFNIHLLFVIIGIILLVGWLLVTFCNCMKLYLAYSELITVFKIDFIALSITSQLVNANDNPLVFLSYYAVLSLSIHLPGMIITRKSK